MKITARNQTGSAAVIVVLIMVVLPSLVLWYSGKASQTVANVTLSKSLDTKTIMLGIKHQIMRSANDVDNDVKREVWKEQASNTLPAGIEGPVVDEWGTAFRYCTWDLGVVNIVNANYTNNNATPPEWELVAKIISAGKSKKFHTSCADVDALGDDIVVKITHLEVASYHSQGVGAVDNFTKLLIHGDGNIIDSSMFTRPLTITNAQPYKMWSGTPLPKFGSDSILFRQDSIINAPWSMGEGIFRRYDWTIDVWVYALSTPATEWGTIVSTRPTTPGSSLGLWFGLTPQSAAPANRLFFGFSNLGGALDIGLYSTTALTTNTWNHVALVRNGDTFTFFINGNASGSTTVAGLDMAGTGGNMWTIGAQAGSQNMLNALLDELRISKNIARWTTNFTPPTHPYELTLHPRPTPMN